MSVTWRTLADVRCATRCEFTDSLAAKHHFLRLPSGRWMRTLGPPDPQYAKHVRGRIWHGKSLTAW